LLKGTASAVPKTKQAEGPTALPEAGAKPEGRNDQYIAFALVFFLGEQVSQIKNHLTTTVLCLKAIVMSTKNHHLTNTFLSLT
jgi:hypothetical protein